MPTETIIKCSKHSTAAGKESGILAAVINDCWLKCAYKFCIGLLQRKLNSSFENTYSFNNIATFEEHTRRTAHSRASFIWYAQFTKCFNFNLNHVLILCYRTELFTPSSNNDNALDNQLGYFFFLHFLGYKQMGQCPISMLQCQASL